MEFFDKITKKASDTYKGAAEKTGKFAKETKLKMKINENKSKINELYQEMGKKVYQKHTSDEEINIKKDLEEECAKIDILSAEIETYHKEILELSDLKVCVNCKEPMEKNAKFCSKCGAEQPEPEENQVFEAEVVGEDNKDDASQNANQEGDTYAEDTSTSEGENMQEIKKDNAEENS